MSLTDQVASLTEEVARGWDEVMSLDEDLRRACLEVARQDRRDIGGKTLFPWGVPASTP
jgi:hypothetical protein